MSVSVKQPPGSTAVLVNLPPLWNLSLRLRPTFTLASQPGRYTQGGERNNNAEPLRRKQPLTNPFIKQTESLNMWKESLRYSRLCLVQRKYPTSSSTTTTGATQAETHISCVLTCRPSKKVKEKCGGAKLLLTGNSDPFFFPSRARRLWTAGGCMRGGCVAAAWRCTHLSSAGSPERSAVRFGSSTGPGQKVAHGPSGWRSSPPTLRWGRSSPDPAWGPQTSRGPQA